MLLQVNGGEESLKLKLYFSIFNDERSMDVIKAELKFLTSIFILFAVIRKPSFTDDSII